MKRACTYGCRKYWTSWKYDKYCTCSSCCCCCCCCSPASGRVTHASVIRQCVSSRNRVFWELGLKQIRPNYKRKLPGLQTCGLAKIKSIQRYHCHYTFLLTPGVSPNSYLKVAKYQAHDMSSHRLYIGHFNISLQYLKSTSTETAWEASYTFFFFFFICVQAHALMINLYSCCIRPCPQYKLLPPLCSYSSSPITISSSGTGGLGREVSMRKLQETLGRRPRSDASRRHILFFANNQRPCFYASW